MSRRLTKAGDTYVSWAPLSKRTRVLQLRPKLLTEVVKEGRIGKLELSSGSLSGLMVATASRTTLGPAGGADEGAEAKVGVNLKLESMDELVEG